MVKRDNTGVYYDYDPRKGIGNMIEQLVKHGYVKIDATHIKLDWSKELAAYEEALKLQQEALKPQPQYVWRVYNSDGGIAREFDSEAAAKAYCGSSVRPCDINRD